ncbi:MAG: hypothetical protein AB1374_12590 [Bacillota bacterium]
MRERICQLEGEWFFIRHTGFGQSKPVVLFIHGLSTGWVSPACVPANWPVIDRAEEFYSFLWRFLESAQD